MNKTSTTGSSSLSSNWVALVVPVINVDIVNGYIIPAQPVVGG